MRPVRIDEVVRLDRYPALRSVYRDAVIRYKQGRRVPVGDKVTLVFEDRETLRFQVQEMVFIERIADPGKVQEEIDVYNELVPGDNELSATLLIEITEATQIRPELDRLLGLDEHVSLRIGEGPQAARVRAAFDPKQFEDDRISAVHYLRFGLEEAAARGFSDLATPVQVEIDHPHYRHAAELPASLRTSLVATLCQDPPPLLRVEPDQSAATPAPG